MIARAFRSSSSARSSISSITSPTSTRAAACLRASKPYSWAYGSVRPDARCGLIGSPTRTGHLGFVGGAVYAATVPASWLPMIAAIEDGESGVGLRRNCLPVGRQEQPVPAVPRTELCCCTVVLVDRQGPRRGIHSMRPSRCRAVVRRVGGRTRVSSPDDQHQQNADDGSGQDTSAFPFDLDDELETPPGAAEPEMATEELPTGSALLVVQRGRNAGARPQRWSPLLIESARDNRRATSGQRHPARRHHRQPTTRRVSNRRRTTPRRGHRQPKQNLCQPSTCRISEPGQRRRDTNRQIPFGVLERCSDRLTIPLRAVGRHLAPSLRPG
jgi:hypothetical protein